MNDQFNFGANILRRMSGKDSHSGLGQRVIAPNRRVRTA